MCFVSCSLLFYYVFPSKIQLRVGEETGMKTFSLIEDGIAEGNIVIFFFF